jgi:hypothetical protein
MIVSRYGFSFTSLSRGATAVSVSPQYSLDPLTWTRGQQGAFGLECGRSMPPQGHQETKQCDCHCGSSPQGYDCPSEFHHQGLQRLRRVYFGRGCWDFLRTRVFVIAMNLLRDPAVRRLLSSRNLHHVNISQAQHLPHRASRYPSGVIARCAFVRPLQTNQPTCTSPDTNCIG